MSPSRARDNFSPTVRTALAKRAGYKCAMCGANTIGSSAQSPLSVTDIGVAAHITAAAPGGPRYDFSLKPAQRCSIDNGIWLCQNHAKSIDADIVTYTAEGLRAIKQKYERGIAASLGIPQMVVSYLPSTPTVGGERGMKAQEFAFIAVNGLEQPYRSFISPILNDRALRERTELGVLMCRGPEPVDSSGAEWTVFVDASWLHWFVNGQAAGYKAGPTIPAKHIYGCVPAWPDSFMEFLEAIVLTESTFTWQRHQDGYLVLAQQS